MERTRKRNNTRFMFKRNITNLSSVMHSIITIKVAMLFVFGHVTGQNIVMAWMTWSLSAQIIKRLKRSFKKSNSLLGTLLLFEHETLLWFRYCFRYLDTEKSLDICPSFKCCFPKGQWHCPFAYTSSIEYSVSCCLVSFSILVHTCVTNFMSSHVYTVCKQTTLHVNSQGCKITIRCTLHCVVLQW